MRQPLFSFKFAFFFSLSLAASSYTVTSTSTFFSFRKLKLPSSAVPKASAADLLALLGPPQQASAVNSQEARQLRSCFKFLVPFSPTSQSPNKRSLSSKLSDRRSINEENELIWWPPAPVMELARLTVDSGGDTAAIQRTLDPTVIPVPDIEGSKEDRCELTRTPYGRLFINEEINSYLESLFEMIVARGPSVGLHVSLSRFDFFHGHVFLAKDSGRLGILYAMRLIIGCIFSKDLELLLLSAVSDFRKGLSQGFLVYDLVCCMGFGVVVASIMSVLKFYQEKCTRFRLKGKEPWVETIHGSS